MSSPGINKMTAQHTLREGESGVWLREREGGVCAQCRWNPAPIARFQPSAPTRSNLISFSGFDRPFKFNQQNRSIRNIPHLDLLSENLGQHVHQWGAAGVTDQWVVLTRTRPHTHKVHRLQTRWKGRNRERKREGQDKETEIGISACSHYLTSEGTGCQHD